MISQKRLLLVAPIMAVVGACGPQSQVAKPTVTPPVKFQLLAFSPAANGQWQARMEQATVTLLDPDKPDRPTAWDGPLRIQLSPAATCEAGLSLVTRVYGASGVDYLVALSYSGSMQYIHFVDLKSCREKWPVRSVYTERIDVAGDTLSVLQIGLSGCAFLQRIDAIHPFCRPEVLPGKVAGAIGLHRENRRGRGYPLRSSDRIIWLRFPTADRCNTSILST